MCDIYMAECEKCGDQINMHIGGYSCKRETVTVWCPSCRKKAEPPVSDAKRAEYKALWDEGGQCWTAAWAWRIKSSGKTVIVYCTDPKSQEVHLN